MKQRYEDMPDPQDLARGGAAVVVCALCGRRHDQDAVHLPYGLRLSLCERHGSQAYLCAEGGFRFVRRMTAIWNANGILNRQRTRALIAHLRMVRHAVRGKDLPGSYAYRSERQEVESRLAAGEELNEVIADIRNPTRWGSHTPPSERTIRRWYQDRRWLKPPIIETIKALTQPVLDALEVLATFGSPGNFSDWISLTPRAPAGQLRFEQLRADQRARRSQQRRLR
jgi:hypothetical protein